MEPNGTLVEFGWSYNGSPIYMYGIDPQNGAVQWSYDTDLTSARFFEGPDGNFYTYTGSSVIKISGSQDANGGGASPDVSPVWDNPTAAFTGGSPTATIPNYIGVNGGVVWVMDTNNGLGTQLDALYASNGASITFANGSSTVNLPSSSEWANVLAVGPDGTAYIPSWNNPVIAEVSPSGNVNVVSLSQDWVFQGNNIVWAGGELWGTYWDPSTSQVQTMSISTSGQLSQTIVDAGVWGTAVGGTPYVLALPSLAYASPYDAVDEIDPNTGAVHVFTDQSGATMYSPVVMNSSGC